MRTRQAGIGANSCRQSRRPKSLLTASPCLNHHLVEQTISLVKGFLQYRKFERRDDTKNQELMFDRLAETLFYDELQIFILISSIPRMLDCALLRTARASSVTMADRLGVRLDCCGVSIDNGKNAKGSKCCIIVSETPF